MSPPRRRSARLAGAAAKAKTVPELSSVAEADESPAREPTMALDRHPASPRRTPATPASVFKMPPQSEMHPSRFHLTTKEFSPSLNLGFSDIKRRDSQQGSGLDSTPTRLRGVPSATPAPSSSFTFRVAGKAADAELSTDAQRMMVELREDAAKIKADLVAQREADETSSSNAGGRIFAKPKGKSSRFSAAHLAEFMKMESIEGHTSAWRAQKGRFTPVKSNPKQTPSKPNSPAKTGPEETPNARPKPNLKRTSSVANLGSHRPPSSKKTDVGFTPNKNRFLAKEEASLPAKRFKQRVEDDASTTRPTSRDGASTRPASRDGSAIPRPTFSAKKPAATAQMQPRPRLMSPTKSSIAHLAGQAKPTVSIAAPSPKPSVANLPKSATTDSVASASKPLDLKRRIITPSRLHKFKSILRGNKSDADNAKSAIPHPVASQAATPAPPRVNKELPPVPLTTPRKKVTKHVTFTPETARVAVTHQSPSPQKSAAFGVIQPMFAGIDSALATSSKSGDVVYPDLSGLKHLIEPVTKLIEPATKSIKAAPTPSVPGTFTFRSDHTIEFGGATSSFGTFPGQSSVRHVRDSIKMASDMPGSFPEALSPTSHSNKENSEPSPKLRLGRPHGMSNKKRHRADSEDEDTEKEAADRAGKKRKSEHETARPLGSTPAASAKKVRFDRPLGQTPGRTPSRTPGRVPGRTPGPTSTATPSKSRPTLTMSRLNMLAQPKHRA